MSDVAGGELRVRIVCLEHARCRPELAPQPDDGPPLPPPSECVVFGALPGGQSACVHVGGIRAKLFVRVTPSAPSPEAFAQLLEQALAHSLAADANRPAATTRRRLVDGVAEVWLRPVYGFSPDVARMYAVCLRDASLLRRAHAVLQQGTLDGAPLEVSGAHVPYLLQCLIEMRAVGMGWLRLRPRCARFRQPLPPPTSGALNDATVPVWMRSSARLQRESSCDVELDVSVDDLLNREEEIPPDIMVPSLAAIWADLDAAPPSQRSQRESEGVQRDYIDNYHEALDALLKQVEAEEEEEKASRKQEEDLVQKCSAATSECSFFGDGVDVMSALTSSQPLDLSPSSVDLLCHLNNDDDGGDGDGVVSDVSEGSEEDARPHEDLHDGVDGGDAIDSECLDIISSCCADATSPPPPPPAAVVDVDEHKAKAKARPVLREIVRAIAGTASTPARYVLRLVGPDGEQFDADYEQSYVRAKAPRLVHRFETDTAPPRRRHLVWRACSGGRVRFVRRPPPPPPSLVVAEAPLQHARPSFASRADLLSELRNRRRRPLPFEPRGPPEDSELLAPAPSAFDPLLPAAAHDAAPARFWLRLAWDPPSASELDARDQQNAAAKVAKGHIDSGGRVVYSLDVDDAFPAPKAQPDNGEEKEGEEERELDNLKIMNVETILACRGALLPDPKVDAVLAVVLVVERNQQRLGRHTLLNRAALIGPLRVPDGVPLARVVPFAFAEAADERALFAALVALIVAEDPDVLSGYELEQQSLGYLHERQQHVMPDAPPLLSALSRLPGGRLRDTLHVPGRIVLNVWRLLRSELKLSSYTLQNAAAHELGATVACYSAPTLSRMMCSAAGVCTALRHVLRCSRVCLALLASISLLERTSELARLFGIEFRSVLSRGSQYRVEAVMIRQGVRQNLAFYSPSREDVRRQPAMSAIPLVMEPLSALYEAPLIVLDFRSLYPSIIIAYNLCYSTCLGSLHALQSGLGARRVALGARGSVRVDAALLRDLQRRAALRFTANGVAFVRASYRQGVLPRLLQELLEARIALQQARKAARPGSARWTALNHRQFGIKMLANVCYGYTAAGFSGRMPCAELADAIVQTARETLEDAMRMVEAEPQWNAKVVYGDTDSLFVLVRGRSRRDAFRIGAEIAARVTASNPAPVALQLEKVYHPCILNAKKRYVGLKYESLDAEPVIDCKGLEMVRRDGCPLVVGAMKRTIELLFGNDLSGVRRYLVGLFDDVECERVPLSRFVFSKEVRLGTYRQAPPGACLSLRRAQKDPRDRVLYAERVPYVVAAGGPHARLRDLVVSPAELLQGDKRINSKYYISKQLLPALHRLTSLVGVDIHAWYEQMPRRQATPNLAALMRPSGGTIERFCAPRSCFRCGGTLVGSRSAPNASLLVRAICSACRSRPQQLLAAMLDERRQREVELGQCEMACNACANAPRFSGACESLACPVMWRRHSLTTAVAQDRALCIDADQW